MASSDSAFSTLPGGSAVSTSLRHQQRHNGTARRRGFQLRNGRWLRPPRPRASLLSSSDPQFSSRSARSREQRGEEDKQVKKQSKTLRFEAYFDKEVDKAAQAKLRRWLAQIKLFKGCDEAAEDSMVNALQMAAVQATKRAQKADVKLKELQASLRRSHR